MNLQLKKSKIFLSTLIVICVLGFVGALVFSADGDLGKRGAASHSPREDKSITVVEAKKRVELGENMEMIPKQAWKKLLTEEQYNILWEKDTEPAFSGSLLKENREGVFITSGCRIPVFRSEHKFKSGTGWPSFSDVYDKKNIILKEDRSWGMRRIEILSKCGEHLGHVFDDGPKPTGLRYCINSAALEFVAAEKAGGF